MAVPAVLASLGLTADDVDPAVPTPEDVIGHDPGALATRHGDVVGYMRALAATGRANAVEYGRTPEGRPLVRLEIGDGGRGADKASVWVGCSIHGDECSGVDAGMLLAYRLAAGEDAVARLVRERAVVHIDICANPDGRERYLASVESFQSLTDTRNRLDLAHRGNWRAGRTNHYQFDLNRDLFAQTQAETRARTAEVLRVAPQVVVELHEMGSDESFLYSAPPGPPHNPRWPEAAHRWWATLADAIGAGMDAAGLTAYRGEWNEVFYPGYMDIWPIFQGAIPIIFEQAHAGAHGVRRLNGRDLAYADAVRGHTAGLLAVIPAAAEHRDGLLADWRALGSKPVQGGHPGKAVILPWSEVDAERLDRLGETLMRQGIEVSRAAHPSRLTARRAIWGEADGQQALAAGSLAVRLDQRLGGLATTLLERSTAIGPATLDVERELLDSGRPTGLYDVTAWSLPLAFDLPAFTVDRPPVGWDEIALVDTPAASPEQTTAMARPSIGDAAAAAWLWVDDGLRVAGRLAATGVNARLTTVPVTVDGRTWPAGSTIVRADENDARVGEVLGRVVAAAGLAVVPVATAKSTDGPDLGTQQFAPIRRPRVGMLAADGIEPTGYGAVFHHLDVVLGLPVSPMLGPHLAELGPGDLDVLVLTGGSGWADTRQLLGGRSLEWLASWVRWGGTLIVIGNATALVGTGGEGWAPIAPLEQPADLARLMPAGAYLLARPAARHHLAAGLHPDLPVLYRSGPPFVATRAADAVVPLVADPKALVLGGLMWPEAAQALAGTTYLSDSAVGRGRVIAFASDPVFRGYAAGTARLFSRAVLVAPPIEGP